MREGPILMLRLMLRQLLLDAELPLSGSAMATLRAQVFAFADEKKAEGWSAEQIIVGIKQIADEAGLRASSNGQPSSPSDALLVDLVSWSVERYYGRAARPSDRTEPHA